jgi:hypothetical protein
MMLFSMTRDRVLIPIFQGDPPPGEVGSTGAVSDSDDELWEGPLTASWERNVSSFSHCMILHL